jgi:hypothetical protein
MTLSTYLVLSTVDATIRSIVTGELSEVGAGLARYI